MNSDKITCLKLLRSFSKKELDHLKELVLCRFFNSDKHVVALLNVLEKYVLRQVDFDAKMQRLIYVEVFPKLECPQNQLNIKQKNLLFSKMSILTRLMEQFLSIKAMKKDDAYRSEWLYPQLLERKQYRLYEMHIKRDKKKVVQQIQKTEDDYAQYYKTEKTILEYLYLKGKWSKEDNLPELVYNLDIYYLLSRLSVQLTSLTLKTYGRTYDFPSQESLNELLNFPAYAKHPVVMLYLACIHLLESEEHEKESNYHSLISLLEEHTEVVSRKYLIDFYKVGIYHCASTIRKGNLFYHKDMFDLYQTMNRKNLILEKGNTVSATFFKNMIMVACRVEEYDWAMEMNEYYQKYIFEEIRSSVYHFNRGSIAFHQKDFDTAHSHFMRVEKINATFYTNSRVLILKCLYEHKNTDYSQSTLTAFRTIEDLF